MLASSEPRAAYQQANFDARVQGGTAQDIVVYCLDELALTLGMLRQADMRGNRAGRSAAITRGIAILTALEMGVDRDNELSASLLHFYEGSRRLLLGSIGETQIEAIDVLRADVIEIRDALKTANSG
ncbi:flagellar protein FliS [Citromicrobium bathyomarinum]|jgi:flagellar protein FliS|uniref:flagellar export chaperone FliS n=1 Tax=Sphingomonadales TaxID=204457 RepID=UPI000C642F7C|nr:flagellar protein FliS [Citromicrobium sp.]MBO81521.1 flagellin [Citromicrobium sp.]|tara:strand:- start:289 stop:669 length:381 start_codon:yes stop_codon:yes gene_type:complete